jgi:hypothetical protein
MLCFLLTLIVNLPDILFYGRHVFLSLYYTEYSLYIAVQTYIYIYICMYV